MTRCSDPKCLACYFRRQEEAAAAAKQRPEDDREECVRCWRFYQKEAEAIVSIDDPIARNRRINAAYAQLWIDDRRFQWAGLAAFASKQVGCGLLHAADVIGKSNRQRQAYHRWETASSPLERLSPYASPRMPIHDQASGEGAIKAYEMLAKGNTALFLDIWPLHKFYNKFGIARFERCLSHRAELRGTVYWPIADAVGFGMKTIEIESGFRAMETGDIAASVQALAWHEQQNVLQPTMYDDPYFALLMRANQFAWALNIPTGSSREIQLALTNKCTVTGANAQLEPFSRQPLANLANINERMAFVLRAAQRFDDLLQHPILRYDVESSLYIIANGGK